MERSRAACSLKITICQHFLTAPPARHGSPQVPSQEAPNWLQRRLACVVLRYWADVHGGAEASTPPPPRRGASRCLVFPDSLLSTDPSAPRLRLIRARLRRLAIVSAPWRRRTRSVLTIASCRALCHRRRLMIKSAPPLPTSPASPASHWTGSAQVPVLTNARRLLAAIRRH